MDVVGNVIGAARDSMSHLEAVDLLLRVEDGLVVFSENLATCGWGGGGSPNEGTTGTD
jgi:hypothetical protein